MRRRLESLARRLWYARRRSHPLLRPLSALYGAVTASRAGRPTERPPVPVIVVGNLTAGGSGKTPVVEALCRVLAEAGREVAIVSRGYGGAEPAEPVRIDSDSAVAVAGDEALMLARSTGVPVWVSRDRNAALEAAVATGAGVVVSDDGLQHTAMARSFEICVIDGRRGFGNGALLPAGPLRQSPDRLSSVDAVLVKAPEQASLPPIEFECFDLRPRGIRHLDPAGTGSALLEPASSIDAVAGISDPQAFFDQLRVQGFDVREHALADHAPIDPKWLASLPGPVVMTAKDSVRLARIERDDLFVAEVEAELPDSLVESVLEHVREFRR